MKWMVLLWGLSAAAAADNAQAGGFADCGSPATLRAAIRDLMGDFGPEYPAGEEYLRRLDAIEQQMASGSDSARAAFEQLQREALLANPLVRAQPILFVVREQYLPDHHNTETIFHTGEPNSGSYRPGGPLKILDPVYGTDFRAARSRSRKAWCATRKCISTGARSSSRCARHATRTTRSTSWRWIRKRAGRPCPAACGG